MWPFNRKSKQTVGIAANTVVTENGITTIDVRSQTCPGYLLAINKTTDALPESTDARLLISYPPCGDGVAAWCQSRNIEFLGTEQSDGLWIIRICK